MTASHMSRIAHSPPFARRARLWWTELTRYPRFWTRLATKPRQVRHHGVQLALFDGMSAYMQRSILKGRYERGEARCLIQKVRPDDVVLEIGGGMGFISALAAHLIGSERVHSYEANPGLIPRIHETYRLNDVAPTVHNEILADGPGSETFYVEDEFVTSSTRRLSEAAREVQVPRVDVNESIRRTGATFLVMDIEGGEAELVPMIDWSPIRAVVVELHPQIIGEEACHKVQDHLAAQGLVKDGWTSTSNKICLERR